MAVGNWVIQRRAKTITGDTIPHNYFTPEGMYSEDPTDPELRIKELKELIHAIHERGMGVILDVVYNHTAKMEILEDIVPGYYHFMDAQGNPKK